jgi:hypothetical protein
MERRPNHDQKSFTDGRIMLKSPQAETATELNALLPSSRQSGLRKNCRRGWTGEKFKSAKDLPVLQMQEKS